MRGAIKETATDEQYLNDSLGMVVEYYQEKDSVR